MSQRDAMQAIDRAKAAIEDAEQYVSELEDEDSERSDLSRSQLEHRISEIISQVIDAREGELCSLCDKLYQIHDELDRLYGDV